MTNDFIWNLVYLGTIINEYSIKYAILILDWNFCDYNVEALVLIMGTKDAISLEKRYLLYSDIEKLDVTDLKVKVFKLLDEMRTSVI